MPNQPSKPIQKAYGESIKARLRDESLDEQWIGSLHDAEWEVAIWRRDYNEQRHIHQLVQFSGPIRVSYLGPRRAGLNSLDFPLRNGN